jgi:FAD/FMN-containing dehydrogenase
VDGFANIANRKTNQYGKGNLLTKEPSHQLTSQLGLTCDTVRSFTLVLPDGTVSTVDSSQSDLFFALKGGLNRFGIVTSAVFSTQQQSDLVYVSSTATLNLGLLRIS